MEKSSRITIPRVAIGGLWHETNTFAPGITRLEDFVAYQYARNNELLEKYTGTNTELGGMIRGSTNIELIPTLFAAAVPSATIEYQSFIELVDDLIERMQKAMPLDGVVLSLHGAAVADNIDDADACILERVRQAVGDAVPIIATFDYHANLSDSMIRTASVLIGYNTFPHTDMAERGEEAVVVMKRLLTENIKLHCIHRKLPLLTSPLEQQTDESPMQEILQKLEDLESGPAIISGSVAMGYPYSDVAHLGASVVVYGSCSERAENAANIIASALWNAKEKFQTQLLPVDTCVDIAVNSSQFPVVIVEPADNVGGGGAGDGTAVLQALLNARADRSVIVIFDPAAVEEAQKIGVGNRCTLRIGGKTDDKHGQPVAAEVVVNRITPGEYVHKGSYMTGYVTSMGQTALVESQGVQIVLTSRRSMPFDAEQLRSLRIEPAEQKIIVVKSAIGWKAAYGDVAKLVLVADTPGVCAADLTRLNYHKCADSLYPIRQSTTFSVGSDQ